MNKQTSERVASSFGAHFVSFGFILCFYVFLCFDSAPSSVSLERQYIDAFKAELECDVNRLLELFDRRQLAIHPGQSCWILHLDVLVRRSCILSAVRWPSC